MGQNYIEVPNILTGKDLDYLSDMFEWNVGALKKTNEAITKVNEEEIKEVMEKACRLFQSNLEMVLDTLLGGQINE